MALGPLRHQQLNEKVNIFSFRRACTSISNHPFYLVMLLFLIGLHQYFPFLFSLLVSASPVLICTAVLLGLLLIHGQPNDNNLKFHEKVSNSGANVRMKVKEHHPYYANREGIFSRDRFSEVRNDIVEKGTRASGMLGSGIRVNSSNLTNEVDEYCNVELSKGNKIHDEKSKNDFGYGKTIEVNEDFGMQDKLKSSLGKEKEDYNGDHHEYEDNVDESSDNESDGVEKSSFDALVADVIPTAQETHPLLDSEEALHIDASKNASILNFELQSLDSNHSSEDSGEDENENDDNNNNDDVNVENMKGKIDGNVVSNPWLEMEKNQQLESLINKSNDEGDDGEEEVEDDDESIEEEEEEDDDDDDDVEEQDNQNMEKDVRTNRVTIWTEEDEKNLRLVGNSELERDLRLENLLARRRAKRNFSMISERNLIDLDRPILPFPVTPISTTRVNPFETPADSKQQHDSSIPPIPGSAPPVRVANKNPFDSPCTSPKEEESLEVSSNNGVFHENGSGSSSSIGYSSSKGKVLRKHETFSTRSEFHSSLHTIQRPYSFRMRPFFVPEHVVGDEDERHSSLSHDSESVVSSSDSDHTESSSIVAMDEDVGHSKDVTVEGDPGEEFVISLKVNTEVHGDQSHDNVSSSTSSVTSEDDDDDDDDDVLEEKDEDDVVSESGFSTKASSNGTIEPPVYDSSPVMEKSTPFSSTQSD